MSGRRKKIIIEVPKWIDDEPEVALQFIADYAYFERARARAAGAMRKASCRKLVAAAEKALRVLADRGAGTARRCREGDRAERKFIEARFRARGTMG